MKIPKKSCYLSTDPMNHTTDAPDLPPQERPRQGPAPGNFAEARSIKRDLLAELRAGWDLGAPPRPEDLLERWPGDPAKDLDAASVLFEDYLQRRQQTPDRQE